MERQISIIREMKQERRKEIIERNGFGSQYITQRDLKLLDLNYYFIYQLIRLMFLFMSYDKGKEKPKVKQLILNLLDVRSCSACKQPFDLIGITKTDREEGQYKHFDDFYVKLQCNCEKSRLNIFREQKFINVGNERCPCCHTRCEFKEGTDYINKFCMCSDFSKFKDYYVTFNKKEEPKKCENVTEKIRNERDEKSEMKRDDGVEQMKRAKKEEKWVEKKTINKEVNNGVNEKTDLINNNNNNNKKIEVISESVVRDKKEEVKVQIVNVSGEGDKQSVVVLDDSINNNSTDRIRVGSFEEAMDRSYDLIDFVHKIGAHQRQPNISKPTVIVDELSYIISLLPELRRLEMKNSYRSILLINILINLHDMKRNIIDNLLRINGKIELQTSNIELLMSLRFFILERIYAIKMAMISNERCGVVRNMASINRVSLDDVSFLIYGGDYKGRVASDQTITVNLRSVDIIKYIYTPTWVHPSCFYQGNEISSYIEFENETFRLNVNKFNSSRHINKTFGYIKQLILFETNYVLKFLSLYIDNEIIKRYKFINFHAIHVIFMSDMIHKRSLEIGERNTAFDLLCLVFTKNTTDYLTIMNYDYTTSTVIENDFNSTSVLGKKVSTFEFEGALFDKNMMAFVKRDGEKSLEKEIFRKTRFLDLRNSNRRILFTDRELKTFRVIVHPLSNNRVIERTGQIVNKGVECNQRTCKVSRGPYVLPRSDMITNSGVVFNEVSDEYNPLLDVVQI